MKNILLLFILFSAIIQTHAQETFPTNGPADERDGYHAFINATIIASPTRTIENGTLVIQKGKIISVGQSKAPNGAIIHDMKGKFIYPSFIELNSDYGLSKKDMLLKEKKSTQPQSISYKKGAFGWNEAIHPEISAGQFFVIQKEHAKRLRKLGFGSVVSHLRDGIARGTGTLVTLAETTEQETLLIPTVSEHFSFSKGSSKQIYPSSLMGTIALLRQSHYDAEWYKNHSHRHTNLSLDAWNENHSLPAFFETNNVLNNLRATKLGNEINKNFILIGGGDDYQKIDAIQETNARLILPLTFPKPYDVSDVFSANSVSLKQMMHWRMAPSNPYFLAQKNVQFALTAEGISKQKEFFKQLRLIVDRGLSKEQALNALTLTPAQFIQQENILGSLAQGKLANFIITQGDIFENESAKILENWVQGHQYIEKTIDNLQDLNGDYNLTLDNKKYQLKIQKDSLEQHFVLFLPDGTKRKTKGSFENSVLDLLFKDEHDKRIRLSGWVQSDGNLKGISSLMNGKKISWSAVKQTSVELIRGKNSIQQEEKTNQNPTLQDIRYPFIGLGWKEQPKQQAVLFKNATVWTNENNGILKNADVLIQHGKIQKIGNDLSSTGAIEIDATGKHLTAGIVDEHSHICISNGVNEGTQASSAEVRIGDVINSEHIGLYRILSGGVTTSQLLHGSANPIGGQSAIIKSRWGLLPEQLKFKGTDGYIKFALGENVKQSNWGPSYNFRFPQTRMGVEQVYNNYFTLAQEYKRNRLSNPTGTRRNLELDAISEIIDKKRFITCHSYVQSEINMLMKTADKFGFQVNTFTHILEGYKVANKMKEHGVGASTFADWWAYKYEVIDAIPYNAAILAKNGIITAINSDDAEMARRLNQEAAKAIKYGGLSAEEAWKTVTLNPAKLLHIDDRVGSIKVGKDADIVLWSAPPMSIYAIAEQTYVDGRKYFDINEQNNRQKEILKEREFLIQLMLAEKAKGSTMQKAKSDDSDGTYSCKQIGNSTHQSIKHHH